MHLVSVRLSGLGPFSDVAFPFCHDDGEPRAVTVIHGGGGVGKTSLLSSIAMTRPGHCVVPPPNAIHQAGAVRVAAEYRLGQDDPDRPHPLCVATPNARVFDDDDAEVLRRREQSLFDKVAREGGFAFVSFGAGRWFAKQPIVLNAPLRSVARYDVRAASPSTTPPARSFRARPSRSWPTPPSPAPWRSMRGTDASSAHLPEP